MRLVNPNESEYVGQGRETNPCMHCTLLCDPSCCMLMMLDMNKMHVFIHAHANLIPLYYTAFRPSTMSTMWSTCMHIVHWHTNKDIHSNHACFRYSLHLALVCTPCPSIPGITVVKTTQKHRSSQNACIMTVHRITHQMCIMTVHRIRCAIKACIMKAQTCMIVK